MMNKYTGITGITNKEEGLEVMSTFEKHGFTMSSEFVPMVGLLISPRNLDPAWSSARYPPLSRFKEIIESIHEDCFLTLHIDERATSSWLRDLLTLIKGLPFQLVGGVQINVKHPFVEHIKTLRDQIGDKKIILQYSDDFISKGTDRAISDLEAYIPLVDYLLIDPSRGVAGGFTPENIQSIILELSTRVGGREFCLDVESGVRVDNVLNMAKVNEYLKNLHSVVA